MTSVIYVNSSSDSEEEEGPPDAKRPRRDPAKLVTSKTLPSKLLQIPKASTTPAQLVSTIKTSAPAAVAIGAVAGARAAVGSYKSMHIPSGITVTKHNNSNGIINIVNPKPSVENNNNNNTNNNNNNNNTTCLKGKPPLKLSLGSQHASVWSKTPTTLATITSVPSPSAGKQLTPLAKGFHKVQAQQKLPQQQQQKATMVLQKVITAVPQKTILAQQKATMQLTKQQLPQQMKQQLPQQTKQQLQLQQQQQTKQQLQQQQLKQQQQLQLQQQKQQLQLEQQKQQQQKQQLQQQKLHLQQQPKQQLPQQPKQQVQLQQQPKQQLQVQQKPQMPQQPQNPLTTLTQQKVLMQQQTQTKALATMQLAQKNLAKLQPQRLPTLQKQALTITPTTTATPTAIANITQAQQLQQKPAQLQGAATKAQKQPPPAHTATALAFQKQKQQQQQHAALVLPPPAAHNAANVVSATMTPPLLAKLTPMPMLSKQPLIKGSPPNSNSNNINLNINSSAARTLPYKTKPTTTSNTMLRNVQQVTSSNNSSTPIQSITAGATPPLRLLATPPHCAAALNEPLLLNLPPTTSITPQLTPTTTPPPSSTTSTAATVKMSFPGASISPVTKTPAKRVQPITVLKKSDEEWRKHIAQQQQQQQQQQQPQQQLNKSKELEAPTIVLVESPPTTPPNDKMDNEPAKRKSPPAVATPANATAAATSAAATTAVRPPLVSEYAALLQLCRETDKSKDMERVIDTKLIKYYYSVHENFVRSRGFRKQLQQAMERIRNEPDMIFVHLKCIVDELKVRRKAKAVQPLQEDLPEEKAQTQPQQSATTANATTEVKVTVESSGPPITPSTGNKRTDERIRKLNRTLYTITKRISALEEADVDWNDDDDSSYLQVERYKKRACQIYEKICDLTGESKSAHRQMKQPILFKDSPYPQFNRTLSAFVNRMHEFPDYHDVLQLLEHCNKDKDLGLATFEMKRIAHDAFVKVGRLLQARRKTDLYETVTHFTANAKDPAASDATLLAKLNENNKKQTKISDILEKFAREQDLSAEEQREARQKEKQLQAEKLAAANDEAMVVDNNDNDEKPCTSAQAAQASVEGAQPTPSKTQIASEKDKENELPNGTKKTQDNLGANDSDTDDDEEEYEEDDEESDEDVDTFVDNFKANGDVSDAESETELNAAPKTLDAAAAHVIVNSETRDKTAAPIDHIAIDAKVDNEAVQMQTQTPTANGKLKDAPTAHMLKIMSVSSLNASVFPNSNNKPQQATQLKPQQQQQRPQQPQQKNKQQKILIDTEIVISDEES